MRPVRRLNKPVRRLRTNRPPGRTRPTVPATALGPLAARAPEEVAGGEWGRADFGAAEMARHRRAPVDVHLTAVVVHARRASHRLGQMLGPYGVDAVVPYALAHQ